MRQFRLVFAISMATWALGGCASSPAVITQGPAATVTHMATATVTKTVTVAVTQAAVQPALAPSDTAARTYISPTDMQTRVSAVVKMHDCSAPARDIESAVFVECNLSGPPQGSLIRFATLRMDLMQAAVTDLNHKGWEVRAGDGWLVAASDPATVERAAAALR